MTFILDSYSLVHIGFLLDLCVVFSLFLFILNFRVRRSTEAWRIVLEGTKMLKVFLKKVQVFVTC